MTAQRKWATTTVTYPQATGSVEKITPAVAEQLLSKNTNNRRMKEGSVRYYHNMIENGKWQLNGESIKVARDGTLLDGQHRLQAIVNSGVPVETFVVRGLPLDSFKTIDAGKSRSLADYVKLDGVACSQPHVLAAAARVAMCFNKDTGEYVYQSFRLSPTDLLQFIANHDKLEQSVEKTMSLGVKKIASASVSAGLHYIFSILDPDAAEEFFSRLESGADLEDGSPILALRNRLIASRGVGRAGAGHAKMTVSYFVSAFNAFRAGVKIKNVTYSPDRLIVLNDFAGAMR